MLFLSVTLSLSRFRLDAVFEKIRTDGLEDGQGHTILTYKKCNGTFFLNV